MSDAHTSAIRQNVDPYPMGSEVKLIWDKLERVGVILFPNEDDYAIGTLTTFKVGLLDAPVIVTPLGERLQPVFWEGEQGLGFWSPEYLLPKEFLFGERPAYTITRSSMYYIEYTPTGMVRREGFMYVDESVDENKEEFTVMPF